jgi:transcriptional regulator with XRE-family HTH domain
LTSIEEIIGARVARLRKEQGMTQAELGRAMAPYVGLSWSRANVSNAEAGSRAWTASDVLAVCMTLRVSPVVLFTPLPDQVGGVQTAGSNVITPDEMQGILALSDTVALSDETAAYIAAEAGRLRAEISRLTEIIAALLRASSEPNHQKEG